VSEVLVPPDGYRVERIPGADVAGRPPREVLRVKRGTCYVADCATIGEVAELVDLSTLVPEQRGS
jgi:hypothetical protein